MSVIGSVITDDWSVVSPENEASESDTESFVFVSEYDCVTGSTTSEVHIQQNHRENAPVVRDTSSISKPFVYPRIQRKSRFRFKPKLKSVPENRPVALSLAEVSVVESEIYGANEDKAQVLANIATKSIFQVSLPVKKIDLREFNFLKTKLIKRLLDELLPAKSARLLWTEYDPELREQWLQEREIEINIRRLLLVDQDTPKRYLANLRHESQWSMLDEPPYKRAMKIGSLMYPNPDEEISEERSWSCNYCTFLNFFETTKCEMCGQAPLM
jgi:hypothetical protein